MRIQIKTKVNKNFKEVFQTFDIQLFMKLKPPLVSFNVKRFDGCKTGDLVELEITIWSLKQRWISLVTELHKSDREIYFTDVGQLLPKPLKYWKHKHIIQNSIDSSVIIDDICYKTSSKLFDILLFPLLFFQFYYRKPVYKSYFRK